jgi:S1-C subfamily serine protease
MTRRNKVSRLFGAVALSTLLLGMPTQHSPFTQQSFAQAQIQTLPSIADLAEKLLPSVVEISVVSKVPNGVPDAGPLSQMTRHSKTFLTSS